MTKLAPEKFELTHLSHSSVNQLLSCPRKFALRRIYRAPERPGWAMVGGSAFHTATEWIDRAALLFDGAQQDGGTFYGLELSDLRRDRAADQGEETPGWEASVDLPCMPGNSAQSLWDRAFAEEIERKLEQSSEYPIEEWRAFGRKSEKWPDKENQDFWATVGPGLVADYVAWRLNTRWPIVTMPDGSPAIEVKVHVSHGEQEGLGYIDRLFELPDGSWAVVDLKSGTRLDPPEQLGDYATKLEELYDVRIRWGCYYKARDGKHTKLVDLASWSKDYFAFRYESARDIIQLGKFPPRISGDCSWCSVGEFCAANGGGRAQEFDPLYELIHGKGN